MPNDEHDNSTKVKQVQFDALAIGEAQKSQDLNLPFCIFRLPNNDLRFFHAFGPNPPNSGEYLVVRAWESNQSFYYTPEPSSKDVSQVRPTSVPQPTSFEDYASQFKKLIAAFSEGILQKAILSRIKNIERPKAFDPIQAFTSLCEQRTETFNYLLNHPIHGLWMGASPEVLLKNTGEVYQTVSLAGTQKKDIAPYHWTVKETEEQELVSTHIRSILKDSVATSLDEVGPFTTEAGNVVHLKTTFQFNLTSGHGAIELADKLHPTPAIAGLPVPLAVRTIGTTETHKRLLYTGLIGLVSEPNNVDLYVNLRCMQIHRDKISIYVGGGITTQSELHAEWDETEEKSKTLKTVIYA